MQLPHSQTVEQDVSQRSFSLSQSSIHSDATISSMAPDIVDKYGYQSAAPDLKHGEKERKPSIVQSRCSVVRSMIYNDVEASVQVSGALRSRSSEGDLVPRRSSMKGSDDYAVHRRSSIGSASTAMVEVVVRGRQTPIQRRRSIDFNANVQVREVLPVTAIADTSSSEMWLQPEDFAKIKSDRRALVEKHRKKQMKRVELDRWGCPIPELNETSTTSASSTTPSSSSEPQVDPALQKDQDDTMRGLEKYLDKSGRSLKNRGLDSVLFEQDEQEYEGIFNDEKIAEMYRSTTYPRSQKALALAQKDHEAVRDYLMSPRTTKLMMRRLSC